MPIRESLESGSFSPEEVQVLVAAFEACCKDLGMQRRDDPLGRLVAKNVIAVGRFNAVDVEEIRKQVLIALRGSKLT
jgi:hypothetical protein